MKSIEYIAPIDELSVEIQRQCESIYLLLHTAKLDELDIDQELKDYFKKCHLNRPIFTLRTSAKMLYDAISLTGKPVEDLSMMDYGAGVSTLYVLAKRIGVGRVYYQDIYSKFCDMARQLDNVFEVQMDDYVVGDAFESFRYCQKQEYEIDLVLSRNVVEHIYDLNDYFEAIYQHYPKAIVYNSTTANWGNPIIYLQHKWIHHKGWAISKQEKKAYVLSKFSELENDTNLDKLIEKTRALGGEDFDRAISEYAQTGKLNEYRNEGSNFSVSSGGWGERLMPYSQIKALSSKFEFEIKHGIWDTTYANPILNTITKLMNHLIDWAPDSLKKYLSPYIYIIAKPKTKTN